MPTNLILLELKTKKNNYVIYDIVKIVIVDENKENITRGTKKILSTIGKYYETNERTRNRKPYGLFMYCAEIPVEFERKMRHFVIGMFVPRNPSQFKRL